MVTGRENPQPTGAPLLPPDLPTPPQGPKLAVGETYMVKHPSIGGQWQLCRIVAHPTQAGGMLVEFPDGTRYEPRDLEIGGKAQDPTQAMPAAPAAAQPQNAVTSPLKPDYEAFRQWLTQLNSQSKTMFQLPLGVLLLMVTRLSVEQETEMTGKTVDFGNVQTFVPDDPSFDRLVENYLYEIQRREEGTSPE